ncbi:hypothetical protein C475_08646 [Halosimplex carlsbadense 2-9-1]|uniref:Uncharacterized protein n=1 Tax=Halosimplex carlsbadense 2-9-1 TaxID=797114 RepID=M0CUV0_9EURY|nr:hypothetical protein [Halosimplex carlsbadense]ELZ26990.1 hypothetical protein C475_08646 [Halosimplex carlsbadense 2-9-1]
MCRNEGFQITARYDGELRKQIERGTDDPLGWIDTVRGEDTELVGGDGREGMKEYLTSFFGGLLQSLVECADGDRGWFTAGNGPLYIVLEPASGDEISVTFCYSKENIQSPDTRDPFEPSVTVRAQALSEAVVVSAEEYLEFVAAVNPELAASSNAYLGLGEDIEHVTELYPI